MSNFEYVTVIASVVVALGFSHLLGLIGSIISNPDRVRGYWLYFVWVFLPVAAWLVFIVLCIFGVVLKREAWHAAIALAWLAMAIRHLLFVSRSVAV